MEFYFDTLKEDISLTNSVYVIVSYGDKCGNHPIIGVYSSFILAFEALTQYLNN